MMRGRTLKIAQNCPKNIKNWKKCKKMPNCHNEENCKKNCHFPKNCGRNFPEGQPRTLTLRSAHPLLTTVSSQETLSAHRPQVIGQMSRASLEWHTSAVCFRLAQASPASSSRQSPCSLCHKVEASGGINRAILNIGKAIKNILTHLWGRPEMSFSGITPKILIF